MWKHPSSPCAMKDKVKPSAGNVILSVLGFSRSAADQFPEKGDNVNTVSYCKVLLMPQNAI